VPGSAMRVEMLHHRSDCLHFGPSVIVQLTMKTSKPVGHDAEQSDDITFRIQI